MNANITSNPPIPTEEDLLQEGFSTEQIQRYTALKDRYPLIEFVISRKEYNRLTLLRWCYRSGRLVS